MNAATQGSSPPIDKGGQKSSPNSPRTSPSDDPSRARSPTNPSLSKTLSPSPSQTPPTKEDGGSMGRRRGSSASGSFLSSLLNLKSANANDTPHSQQLSTSTQSNSSNRSPSKATSSRLNILGSIKNFRSFLEKDSTTPASTASSDAPFTPTIPIDIHRSSTTLPFSRQNQFASPDPSPMTTYKIDKSLLKNLTKTNVYVWEHKSTDQSDINSGINVLQSHNFEEISQLREYNIDHVTFSTNDVMAIDSNRNLIQFSIRSREGERQGYNVTVPSIVSFNVPEFSSEALDELPHFSRRSMHSNSSFTLKTSTSSMQSLGSQASQQSQQPTRQSSERLSFNMPRVIVKNVTCGVHHWIVLTNDGQLYSSGDNSQGQLGLGKHVRNCREANAVVVRDLEDNMLVFKEVVAGGLHTLAVTRDDRVYAWGSNKNGRCGISTTSQGEMQTQIPVSSPIAIAGSSKERLSLGPSPFLHRPSVPPSPSIFPTPSPLLNNPPSCVYTPFPVFFPDSESLHRTNVTSPLQGNARGFKVLRMACGWGHSLVVVEKDVDGEMKSCVYSFGKGDLGQLGHGYLGDEVVPKAIECLYETRITDAAAGYYHTALLTARGVVLTFGGGSEGQLGHGDMGNRCTPTAVISSYFNEISESQMEPDRSFEEVLKSSVSPRSLELSDASPANYFMEKSFLERFKQMGKSEKSKDQSNVLRSMNPIQHIYCGAFNTMAFYPGTALLKPQPLVGHSPSMLYCWGSCGGSKILIPTPVPQFENKQVVKVVGGVNRTLALVKSWDRSEDNWVFESFGLPLSDVYISSSPSTLSVANNVVIGSHGIKGTIYLTKDHLCFYAAPPRPNSGYSKSQTVPRTASGRSSLTRSKSSPIGVSELLKESPDKFEDKGKTDAVLEFYHEVDTQPLKIVIPIKDIMSIEKTVSKMAINDSITIFTSTGKFDFTELSNDSRNEIHTAMQGRWLSLQMSEDHELSRSFSFFESSPPPRVSYSEWNEGGPSDRDVYGFVIPPELRTQYADFARDFEENRLAETRKGWEKLIRKHGKISDVFANIMGNSMDDGNVGEGGLLKAVSKSGRLLRLVRKGVPPELRGQVWYYISGAHMKEKNCVPNYYQQLLRTSPAASEFQGIYGTWLKHSHFMRENDKMIFPNRNAVQSIELDLDRTFPEHLEFVGDSPMKEKLRRVLLAYSRRNPYVGYCQSMNTIAGVLLLFMPEEKAFYTLCTIVEDYHVEYFGKSMIGILVDQSMFDSQMDSKMPDVTEHLQSESFPCSAVTFKWFICIFWGILPTETTLQIWDWYFLDGLKVLMVFSACIFRHLQRRILNNDSLHISMLMTNAPKEIFDISVLFKLYGELSVFYDELDITTLRPSRYTILTAQLYADAVRKKSIKNRNKLRHHGLKTQLFFSDNLEVLFNLWENVRSILYSSDGNGKRGRSVRRTPIPMSPGKSLRSSEEHTRSDVITCLQCILSIEGLIVESLRIMYDSGAEMEAIRDKPGASTTSMETSQNYILDNFLEKGMLEFLVEAAVVVPQLGSGILQLVKNITETIIFLKKNWRKYVSKTSIVPPPLRLENLLSDPNFIAPLFKFINWAVPNLCPADHFAGADRSTDRRNMIKLLYCLLRHIHSIPPAQSTNLIQMLFVYNEPDSGYGSYTPQGYIRFELPIMDFLLEVVRSENSPAEEPQAYHRRRSFIAGHPTSPSVSQDGEAIVPVAQRLESMRELLKSQLQQHQVTEDSSSMVSSEAQIREKTLDLSRRCLLFIMDWQEPRVVEFLFPGQSA
ncbi:RabGAP/TBC domain-containing protein [Planoprotostelium fungivorum]|uniref:RabGAP/TBC domain-containing protein n=1 Tax=Planoprotostelium fungivorum TaxID=1890364 RepID=A0A2P6N981_9EUKA|nr:RabGAP/TBC domain-containing protein [Planoprotostelium fungivorum]